MSKDFIRSWENWIVRENSDSVNYEKIEPTQLDEQEQKELIDFMIKAKTLTAGYESNIIKNSNFLILAKKSNHIIGCIALKKTNSNYINNILDQVGYENDTGNDYKEIGYFYVLPTERNQGIGGNLLKTLLGEISGDLFATIKVDNAISKATFISSGFTPIGDFESPSTGNELSVFISVR